MLAYAPAAVWAAFLLLLGSRPDLPAVASPFPLDKLAHLLLYGLLGLLAGRGWRAAGRRPAWVWPLMGALLVGILDELHQEVVPGRTTELLDLAADGLGVGLGFLGPGGRLVPPFAAGQA